MLNVSEGVTCDRQAPQQHSKKNSPKENHDEGKLVMKFNDQKGISKEEKGWGKEG